MTVVAIESIPAVGQDDAGRGRADVESMPGVMAYGVTRETAITAVRGLALGVAGGLLRQRGRHPRGFHEAPLGRMSQWKSVTVRQLLGALLPTGWDRVAEGVTPGVEASRLAKLQFAFHDSQEIGPGLGAPIAKQ